MGNGILYGAQTALHKLYPEFLKVTAPGWKIYRNTCGMSVANMTGVFLILLVWMDGRNLSTLHSKSEYNEKRPDRKEMDTNGIDRDWRSGVRRKPVSGK